VCRECRGNVPLLPRARGSRTRARWEAASRSPGVAEDSWGHPWCWAARLKHPQCLSTGRMPSWSGDLAASGSCVHTQLLPSTTHSCCKPIGAEPAEMSRLYRLVRETGFWIQAVPCLAPARRQHFSLPQSQQEKITKHQRYRENRSRGCLYSR